jgi:hypothetical protein
VGCNPFLSLILVGNFHHPQWLTGWPVKPAWPLEGATGALDQQKVDRLITEGSEEKRIKS